MGIQNKDELKEKIRGILNSAKATLDKLDKITADNFIFEGKFGQLGTKLTDSCMPEDLGEQIQQSMTVLMTCYAVYWLNENTNFKYPFETSEAANNGADIYKKDSVTCEVFAAKNPWNNKKLYHDLNAIAKKGEEKEKYIFYCSDKSIEATPQNKPRQCAKENVFGLTIIEDSKTQVFTAQWKNKENSDADIKATIVYITPKQLRTWFSGILSAPSGVSGLSQEN